MLSPPALRNMRFGLISLDLSIMPGTCESRALPSIGLQSPRRDGLHLELDSSEQAALD